MSDKSSHTCVASICHRPASERPPRTFSNVDFSNCQCNLILNTVYSQMVDHCRGIERKDKTLTAILEFVEVLLAASNVPQARKLLDEAEEILAEIFKPGREDELITLPYLTGKIKTLQGRCNLESGLIVEALRCLQHAINSLGYSFPRTRMMARCKAKILFQEQKLMLTCLRDWRVGAADGDAANYNDQLAKCLAQMFIVFRAKGMQDHARLAAIWGLNAALASNKDFFALCTAYSNMMTTAHECQYRNVIPFLENEAIRICARRGSALEMEELQAVAKLYSSIFFSHWLRGETAKGSSLGFVTLKIARTFRSVTLRLTLLPRLIHLLMVECRHNEAVVFLRELEFLSNNDMDKSGQTWYYALCVDFQLEAGITVIPFDKCEKYFQEEGDTMINLRDPEAERRYFTSMWLWCLRMEAWEAATVWRNEKVASITDEYTVAASVTSLKKLEGLLIYYVHKLDNRNAKVAAATFKEIQKQFKIIEKVRKVVKATLARYLLMRAYYKMIHCRSKAGLKLLGHCKQIAQTQQNRMIYHWADHCEKAWTGSLSSIQRDFWKESRARVSQMNWQEVGGKTHRVVPYTLPLPSCTQHF